MENNYCIIMAGGIGSRFWPLSTPKTPKQFLDVLGLGKSLLQMTFDRLKATAPAKNIYVVTNAAYFDMVQEQLPEICKDQILTEPMRKNTAPCITYAAAKIYSINPEANLVIAPSDHLILKEEKFTEMIEVALEAANKEERLITLGIKPSRPDTGYGYIEFVDAGDILPGEVRSVKNFKEKPNKEVAELFLKSGNYYWNSGIFVWKAKTILKAIEKFKPDLFELFDVKKGFYNTASEQEEINKAFERCEDISIDFAVMENAKNIDVVLANFDWSDLGTWGSVYTHMDKDYKGNAIVSNDNVFTINSSNCVVNLPDNKLALIEGLEGYIVVESNNMLMILSKDNEQNLSKYMKEMKESKPEFF